jgi:hypothetical protein
MKQVWRAAACAMMCASFCATSAPAAAQAQTAPVRATFGGRMHFQWNSTSVGRADLAAGAASLAQHSFEQRRVRIGADVQVSDWIRGRVEPELSMGRLTMRSAWVAFELDPAFVIRAGQMKKPFGVVWTTSGSTSPVIERGVRIRGLADALRAQNDGTLNELRGELLVGEHYALLDVQRYTAYDMGVTLEGRRGSVGWAGGVFNGGGADTRAESAGPSGAARVTWQPPVAAPLVLGAGWSRRVMNWPQPRDWETRSGNAFEVDLELGSYRRGLWVLGEVATGDQLAAQQRFVGAQLITAYYVSAGAGRVEGWEPVARVSHGDPDRSASGDEGILFTPGVNVYFVGRNRLMLNWDVYVPSGDRFTAQHALRAQVNLHY